MIGIYKFTNKITGQSYIGQSKNLKRRFNTHKNNYNKIDRKTGKYVDGSYLHQMMRKYGFDNFSYEILEECAESDLLDREIYYIEKFNTISPNGYNLSAGGNNPHFMKLNAHIVESICVDLEHNLLSVNEIGNKYNLNPYTISLINVGKLWRNDNRVYPIREKPKKEIYYCIKCGKPLFEKTKTNMCSKCFCNNKTEYIPNKDTLYDLLLHNSFTKIGSMFGVSDNAVRKWCVKYGLPKHSSYYKKQGA